MSEMLTPSIRRAASPPPFAIRQAGIDDLDRVEAIERACFDFDGFARRRLRSLLINPRVAALIAEGNEDPLGYVFLLDQPRFGISRVYSIAVTASARGRGVGDALLVACEQTARDRGAKRLRLEFRQSNVAARRLYERAGFILHKIKSGYYDDNGEAAVLMEKPL